MAEWWEDPKRIADFLRLQDAPLALVEDGSIGPSIADGIDALRARLTEVEEALREIVSTAQDERYSNEYVGIVLRSRLAALAHLSDHNSGRQE